MVKAEIAGKEVTLTNEGHWETADPALGTLLPLIEADYRVNVQVYSPEPELSLVRHVVHLLGGRIISTQQSEFSPDKIY